MLAKLIILVLLTLSPFLELRASIPYGIFQTDLSLLSIFLICTITNIALAPVIWFFLDKVVHIFLRIKFIDKYYQKTVERAQRRVHKYVEKYGIIGLGLFIGIPFPGSGVYTGALGAYILGFKFKDYFKATLIGVLIAGVLVTLISVSGENVFYFLIRKI